MSDAPGRPKPRPARPKPRPPSLKPPKPPPASRKPLPPPQKQKKRNEPNFLTGPAPQTAGPSRISPSIPTRTRPPVEPDTTRSDNLTPKPLQIRLRPAPHARAAAVFGSTQLSDTTHPRPVGALCYSGEFLRPIFLDVRTDPSARENPGHRRVPSVPARRSCARAVEWRGASRRAFSMDHAAVRGPAAGAARRIRTRAHTARFQRWRTVLAGPARRSARRGGGVPERSGSAAWRTQRQLPH